MNNYGLWNARGTSNSEYGRFNFFQNMKQQAPTSQGGAFNFGGHTWGGSGGYGQQQQHAPDCQNVHQGYYGQQQGYTQQNYYHHPGCPNAAQNKWTMQQQQQQQGQDQQDGSQPRFTIQVGEEAAAAALGGHAQFRNHFSIPQQQQGQAPMTTMMMTPQQGNDEGTGETGQQYQGNSMDGNNYCSATSDESAATVAASDNPGEIGGDSNNGGGQGDFTGNAEAATAAADNSSAQATPQVQATPAAKPGKWRGLNTVKYGRNIPPRSGDMSKQIQQLESRMHHLQFNPGEMAPANPRLLTAKSASSMTALQESGQEQSGTRGGGARNRLTSAVAPKPNLCGKCNKCKAILPPDMGPSTLTFPSRSSMSLKTNTGARSKHYLGRQDAQNFKAVNHYREHHT